MTTIEVLKWNIFFQKGDDMLMSQYGCYIKEDPLWWP
jgi:hypothetical protein